MHARGCNAFVGGSGECSMLCAEHFASGLAACLQNKTIDKAQQFD
jgi:hypothetical protein